MRTISRMKFLRFISKYIGAAVILIVSLAVLTFFVKGDTGTPVAYQTLTDPQTNVAGPYESSNSRSRYVLTESLVKNNSATLTESQASFASPDVSQYNGKFFSIFMPGISFIGIPFYMLGNVFNMPQLATYLSVTLFGFLSMLLIAVISFKLGVNKYASILAGFIFLFATNALSYAVFFTQHVTSAAFILLGLLAVIGKPNIRNAVLFGAAFGSGLLMDVPNVILMFPMGIAFLVRYFNATKTAQKIRLNINPRFLMALFGLLPFIAVLGWYNMQTTGTYTKIGQSVGQSTYFMDKMTDASKAAVEAQAPLVPFNPRSQMTGFYTLLISDERSWLFYSPILLLGVFGIAMLYRQEKRRLIANTIAGTVLLSIVLYGMFHDPWGGWAFGARYLIPAAAMMAIGLGVAIQHFKAKLWFMVGFNLLAIYSLGVSVLGALTTAAIPPKDAAAHMLAPIPYTYEYNFQLAKDNVLSSLVYNTVLRNNISGLEYAVGLTAALTILMIILYFASLRVERRIRHDA